jgi:hypothetical protein
LLRLPNAQEPMSFFHPPSAKSGMVYLTGVRHGKTFRLELNRSWEAIDVQTGAAVLISKGSHKAVRILHRAAPDAKEEPWLVVTIHHQGKPVSAGLREAYWRQWERHHVPEFRVTIEEWKENAPPSAPKARP